MEKCLPRFLRIKLLSVSLFLIMTGFGFLWFGMQSISEERTSDGTKLTSEVFQQATSSATFGIAGERAVVSKVVDGDTLELVSGKTVRFIGIDTPETVDPRRPVGCFGKEASNETKGLLSGKEVILQKDVSDTDKYDRLLRLIFLPLQNGQILFVNDYLVREGFARVLTYPPDVKYNEKFRQAENEAKENKRGLWGNCVVN